MAAAAFLALGLWNIEKASVEGVTADVICRHLIANTTEGRQALVSSLWWPPLALLLRLPFAAVLDVESGPAASLIVSAAAAAIALWLFYRILADCGLAWWKGLLIAAGLAVNPGFLRAATDGSFRSAAFCCALAGFRGFLGWLIRRRLRDLICLALCAGLMVGLCYDMALWSALLILLACVHAGLPRASKWYREAVIIIAFFPFVYAVGLWILANWLIMGDVLRLFRPFAAIGAAMPEYDGRSLISPAHFAAGVGGLGAAVCAALSRKMPVGLAGVAVAGLLGLAMWEQRLGLLWDESAALFSIVPLGVCAAVWIAAQLRSDRSLVRPIVFLASLVLLAADAMIAAEFVRRESVAAGEVWAERNRELPRIERNVLSRSRYATVIVAGYDGFALLGSRPDRIFLNAIDFTFEKYRCDYPGHDLFLLIRKPEHRSAMECVYWRYPGIWEQGSGTTVYDGDWGSWRLFEIVQAPRGRLRRGGAADGGRDSWR